MCLKTFRQNFKIQAENGEMDKPIIAVEILVLLFRN
jgi:hypothetical protein